MSSENEREESEFWGQYQREKADFLVNYDIAGASVLIVDKLPPNPKQGFGGVSTSQIEHLLADALEKFFKADDIWRHKKQMAETYDRMPKRFKGQPAMEQIWKHMTFGQGGGGEIPQNLHQSYYRPIGNFQLYDVFLLVREFADANNFPQKEWRFYPKELTEPDGSDTQPARLHPHKRLLLLVAQFLYPGYGVTNLMNVHDHLFKKPSGKKLKNRVEKATVARALFLLSHELVGYADDGVPIYRRIDDRRGGGMYDRFGSEESTV